MLDYLAEKIKKIFSSRLLPISIGYGVFIVILVIRLFQIQIVKKDQITENVAIRDEETREIETPRGIIYDRNGVELAYNELTYSVVIEDSTSFRSSAERNKMLYDLINILEKHGNEIETDFPIALNEDGELVFIKEGTNLLRFKANIYGYGNIKSLKPEEKNATALEDFNYLRYGDRKNNVIYNISDEYSMEDALKIMTLRYAIASNYPKYNQIVISSDVDEETVAAVLENSYRLPGVEITQKTSRRYNESLYASHILGYTGLINSEELETYNADGVKYSQSDRVGKSGLEKVYESELAGKKGTEVISVNAAKKYVETLEKIDPVPGNDLHLTIDIEMTKAFYHIIEKNLSNILLSKIQNSADAGSRGRSTSDIKIPIYDVYYALINNNVIKVDEFVDDDATDLEKETYAKYLVREEQVIKDISNYLSINNERTVKDIDEVLQEYASYVYSLLRSNKILLTAEIDTTDASYLDYQNGKIGLNKFLQYAISKNWIDLSKLDVGEEYYSTEELYEKLVDITIDKLKNDNIFHKKIYKDLVYSYKLSGTEICLLLFDQGVLKYDEQEIAKLSGRVMSAYTFITNKIRDLEITPAQLALEPSSASVVLTDVQTGEVISLVTYPSYDNNMFANKVDADYYASLQADLTKPMIHRATKESFAPGSTFKMTSSIAGLEENVIQPATKIYDLVKFTKITPSPKCWSNHSHGSIDVTEAIEVSCNYFFYQMSYDLGLKYSGNRDQNSLKALEKYATILGLNKKSGIEIEESEPKFSTKDSIRTAIGQGESKFAPIQLSRYVTTIASSGKLFDLTLINKIEDKNGNIVFDNAPNFTELNEISSTSFRLVQEGMYKVAHGSKSSSSNVLSKFPYEIAGKTGTAQTNANHANHALFVSYAPYDKPEISITTVIPNGYASSAAVNLTYDLYSYYYKTQTLEEILTDTENNQQNAGPALGD